MGSAFRQYKYYLVIDNAKQFRNGASEYMKEEGIVGLSSGGNSNHNGNHNSNGTNGTLNGGQPVQSNISHCTGCRELKREVDDLRRLVSHFIEPRSDASQAQTNRAPPEMIARLQQQQQQSEMPLHNNCPPQLLPWLLNNGLAPSSPTNTLKLLENLEAARNANTAPLSAFWSTIQNNTVVPTSSSANTNVSELSHAVAASLNNANIQTHGNNFMDHQVVMESSETSSSPSSTNTQLMLVSPQQQMRQATLLNGNTRNVLDSLASQLNTNAVSQLLNMTSNANISLQQQIANLLHAQKQQELPAQIQQSLLINNNAALQQQRQQLVHQQQQLAQQQRAVQQNMPNITRPQTGTAAAHITTERGGPPERRMHSGFQRAASDDYVRIIRHQDLSEDNVRKIQIPVPEALQLDPNFRPLPEQQVIQQVMQNKKYESVNVSETMAQLCKKLAEKRVFGSRLMAQTTVAAPNHSNYNNLPNDGIIYIQHVCRKVLGGRVESDEEFWECFREAMRKLAARCRRVRHAKKVRSPKVEDIFSHHRVLQPQINPSAFILKQQELLQQQQQLQKSQRENQAVLMGMEVDPIVDIQQGASPPESQTFSSPSRNSSTPTPSSSSKQDN